MSPSLESRKDKYQIQFQPLLNRCKEMVLVYVSTLLTELFANSDKALRSFADKAENNEVQNRFLEAMAVIRKRSGLVEHEFCKLLGEDFDRFWMRNSKQLAELSSFNRDTELSLVDYESMDETTAIENIISKASDAHRTHLYALGQRLTVINGGENVKIKRVPAGPAMLVSAFNEAIDALGLESRIHIIVLALFDKYVMKQLGTLYEDYNNNLRDAGVLPHLRPTVQQTEEESKPDAGAEEEAEEGSEQELGEELFNSILDLMEKRRGGLGARPGATGAAREAMAGDFSSGAPTGPARGHSGQPVTTANLVSALNDIQPLHRADFVPDVNSDTPYIPNVESDEQVLTRIKHSLTEERQKLFAQVDREQVDAVDEDTIDLVGMLFEYMLNDPVLPVEAKALISHLHTPYLKVAIIDRRLLTDSDHDARQLLDSMLEAGSHWIDEHNLKRGIYPDMQIVVDRVLMEFSDHIRLFGELLTFLHSRMEEFRRKSEILEKRAQDSARGREKLGIARQRSVQEMKARTFNTHLPQVGKDFLLQTWADKLIFILLRHPEGEMSDDWEEALRTADELVWAFEPKTSVGEQTELKRVLPYLRNTIENGLESLGGFHQEKSRALFELLATPETASVAGKSAAAISAKPEPTPEVDKHAIPAMAVDGEVSPGEMLIPVRESEMMDRIRKIEFGTWFELPTDRGETKRVRLSWFSPLTASCMFVDRAGVQTAIKPLRTLAQEIIQGRSKILEESSSPFVERTLRAIRRMLQRSLKATEEVAADIAADEETSGKQRIRADD